MAGLVHYGKSGTLTLNGVSMNCPAWDIPNLTVLRSNRETTGSNARIAGLVGSRAKRRRYAEVEFQLAGFLIGHATRLGVAVVAANEGLQANIDYLLTNVVDPVAEDGDPSIPAVLTVPGQANRAADVQAEFVFGDEVGNAAWTRARVPFVLRLTVPVGRFA